MLSWLRIFDIFKIPERVVETRSGLSRRNFLKAIGVAAVTVAVPKLILPEKKVFGALPPNGTSEWSREVKVYGDLNEALFEKLSGDACAKEAINAVNDFTRTKMREDGFFRRIMPPLENIGPIPFSGLPVNLYIRGPRYKVAFDRIVTPRFTRDVDELQLWTISTRGMPGFEGPNRAGDGFKEAKESAQARTRWASNDDERRAARAFWDVLRGRHGCQPLSAS